MFMVNINFSMNILLNYMLIQPYSPYVNIPVVPHKAVAEVSKIGNL